jgi:hypothetical protein
MRPVGAVCVAGLVAVGCAGSSAGVEHQRAQTMQTQSLSTVQTEFVIVMENTN